MNVADLLSNRALATPQAVAVIHGEREFSYARWEALVWGLCRHLHECGLRPGDVVGLHLMDPLLHLAAVLSLARMGVVSVAVAAALADTQAGRRILQRTRATAIIDGEPGLDWGLRTRIGLERDPLCAMAAAPEAALYGDRPDQLLHFKTSSGTTGTPKIVSATHAGMISSIAREIHSIGYLPGERYLTPVALSYDGPRRRYLACLASGATAVLPPLGGDVASWIETIDRFDVRHFSCVASQAHELARAVPAGRQRFPRMRCLRLSAGPSDASLHRLLRERLCERVLVSYGCTELGPITVAPPELLAAEPRTTGRAMPGIELQVVDSDGAPQGTHTVGLIRIRAEGMPSAYHDDPEATAAGFKDGWFYPGDLGQIGDDGLLFHMGRADDMMVFDGVNIYPAEIEQAMLSHPAVRDAVALPLAHRVAHQVPVCAVALHGGRSVAEQELLAFARGKLGAHRPRRVVILDAIPRNEHGKVQRKVLAQSIAAKLDGVRPWGQLPLYAQAGLTLPAPFDLDRLDAWLGETLQLELRHEVGLDGALPHDPEQAARVLLRRQLLLARLLMQAARLPVFDEPQIVRLRPQPQSPGTWQAVLSFARIEEIPPAAYEIAFDASRALTAWAMERPFDAGSAATFHAMVQQHVSSRLGKMMPPGKSTLPVLRAAHHRSIPFTHLGAGVFQLGWGSKAQRIDRSVTGRDSAIGARLCANKAATALLLRKAGLPAPTHQVATSEPDALRAAHQIGWPVVVKPLDRERGEGVVVDIVDDDGLKAAFESARALSGKKAVIVERQVQGVCHRLFMAHGKLLYAVKRLPMCVLGDGVSDVASLVDAELARQLRLPPWQRSGIRPLDDLARAAIARAGLAPGSVPPKGTRVPLRRIETTEWGGVDDDVTQHIHPENLKVARAATELFGLDMAGIDVITPDISRPWFDNGAIVNEVNFAPLLGGGEISRSHIPDFLDEFIDGTGTIPVEVFVGGAHAWSAARRRWQEMVASGVAAYLSHTHKTLEPSGQEWHMPLTGLHPRTRALVLCNRVQALVLVVQSDEFLLAGLPLEAVSAVTVIDHQLVAAQAPSGPLPDERIAELLCELAQWRRLAPAHAPAP